MDRPGSGQFTAHTTRRNGVARIAVQGDLDLGSVRFLAEHLDLVTDGASANGNGVPGVILDLRALTFIDSTGLQTVLDAARSAAERGHRFAAVGVGRPVRKLFEITGTVDSLNEAAALELIRRFSSASGEEPS
jgi:anti-sigma B factor antagonist